jgi:hypothetical protein
MPRHLVFAPPRKTASSQMSGPPPAVFRPYLASLGWLHTPITNRKIYLRADQLPSGRIIVEVREHLVAVINGIIHDTYNSGMNGHRPVTNYYTAALARRQAV